MNSEKFAYFMERTEEDLKEIRSDVRKLLELRWKQAGAMLVISALVSGMIAIIFGRG